MDIYKPLLPKDTFSDAGIIVGPISARSEDGTVTYAWSRPFRLLVWLLQWCTHTLFLTYAGASFVIIGTDPHCSAVPPAAFCQGTQPGMLARIAAIYSRLGWACHLVAIVLYVLTMALAPAAKSGGSSPKAVVGNGAGAAPVKAGKDKGQ